MPRFPTETYEAIFKLLPAPALWRVGEVRGGPVFAALRLRIFADRWKKIVTPYMTFDDVEWFVRCMLESDAAIVGSSALWFMEPSAYWSPTNLNLVMPRNRGGMLLDFFLSRG